MSDGLYSLAVITLSSMSHTCISAGHETMRQILRFCNHYLTLYNSTFRPNGLRLHSLLAVRLEVLRFDSYFSLRLNHMTAYYSSITHLSNQVLRNFCFYLFFTLKKFLSLRYFSCLSNLGYYSGCVLRFVNVLPFE